MQIFVRLQRFCWRIRCGLEVVRGVEIIKYICARLIKSIGLIEVRRLELKAHHYKKGSFPPQVTYVDFPNDYL